MVSAILGLETRRRPNTWYEHFEPM